MDKKKIIEEGVLERYLLGELMREEHALIENSLQKDSDLMVVYRQLEEDFEKMAFENAIEPPKHVKNALMATLASEGFDKKEYDIGKNDKKSKVSSGLLVAASLALLFALTSLWLYTRGETAQRNLKVLQQQTSDLQLRLQSLEKNYEETTDRYSTITDPNAIPLILEGNQTLPNSRAVAYLNHRTKEVIVNPQGLPKLENSKTYQMWADVEGEMISMGTLPTTDELVALKYIDSAESLNITIEPAGGSEHATVANLVSNIIL